MCICMRVGWTTCAIAYIVMKWVYLQIFNNYYKKQSIMFDCDINVW